MSEQDAGRVACWLGELWQHSTVRRELYNLLCDIANPILNSRPGPVTGKSSGADGAPRSFPEDVREAATDFLVALAKGSPTADIRTRAQLKREFRRWLTRRNDPGRNELWRAVSAALRALEKDGKAVRGAAFRGFHNSNDTTWALTRYTGTPGDWAAYDPVRHKHRLPTFSGGNQTKRVLTPGEARELVLALLGLYAGEVCMREIFQAAAQQVVLLRRGPSLDASDQTDGDGDDMYDRIESDRSFTIDGWITIETSERAELIWSKLGEVRRGRDALEARRVLCCYFLPKTVLGRSVKLADIGPTSTVNDIVNKDIRPLLRTYLTHDRTRHEQSCEHEQWAFGKVVKGVVESLLNLCSENGYCPVL